MSNELLAAYTFLPYARQGLGVYLQETDPASGNQPRGSINVSLQLNGEKLDGETVTDTLSRTVQLYGPGDVIGIDSKVIVRTEPRDWITNFEPNYLPFIEFYEEDFPWRYTPAKPSPDKKRLRPWLTLVVLEESEFGPGGRNDRLSFIEVTDADQKFPPADQLWAWAHVHVNDSLGVDPSNTDALAAQLDATVLSNRDLAYSRLLCPRALKENTAYHAFLIPTFETGRLAGLEEDLSAVPNATHSAWATYPNKKEATKNYYPYYYRWYFRTGTVGDFEYLVRLLQPRTVDARVGRRDMDVRNPGAGLPGMLNLQGILRLGGALRAPLATLSEKDRAEYTNFEEWGKPYPHPLQTALANLVNLADDYAKNDQNEDPVIVPPLYGRWHSLTQRLVAADGDPARNRWVQELNLDPRYRVSAGFGTKVVQSKQEDFMEAAWQQVGKVLEANHKIRLGHMAKLTSQVWHSRELGVLAQRAPERCFTISAPVQQRLLTDGLTIAHQVRQSTLPRAVVSKTIRQALRPRGRMVQLVGFDARRKAKNDGTVQFNDLRTVQALDGSWIVLNKNGSISVHNEEGRELERYNVVIGSMISKEDRAPVKKGETFVHWDPHLSILLKRINKGEVSAAPPKVIAPDLPTEEKLTNDLRPRQLPTAILDLLQRLPLLRFLPLLLAVLLVVLLLMFGVGSTPLATAVVLAGASLWLTWWLGRIRRRAQAADALRPDARRPSIVDEMPLSPNFRIGNPGTDPVATIGAVDSPEAIRFKGALRNLYSLDQVERSIPILKRQPLRMEALVKAVVEKLNPDLTVPRRVLSGVTIPARIREQLTESFGEVMVYPEINLPMYLPLKDLSTELFLPNIQLVENNSITLLETNRKFVESYMVGLNHEFGCELLWREYPTDQRGSYFRQFWDVSGFLGAPGTDPEALRERLRDIPELHTWSRNSALGSHDHRKAQGDKEEELVLVIRGELLKKYPTAVVYAHRARWDRKSDNTIDKTKPRRLVDLSSNQEANPPRDLIKTPLYEAKVDPEIYFLGFDLTASAARGGEVDDGEEDPGWFFVIKERPGEPRFGLDLPKPAVGGPLHTWNDLSWSDVMNNYAPGAYLSIGEKAPLLTSPNASSEEKPQYDEDSVFQWRADTHAAEVAYILFQLPVLMAVHAAELLKKPG